MVSQHSVVLVLSAIVGVSMLASVIVAAVTHARGCEVAAVDREAGGMQVSCPSVSRIYGTYGCAAVGTVLLIPCFLRTDRRASLVALGIALLLALVAVVLVSLRDVSFQGLCAYTGEFGARTDCDFDWCKNDAQGSLWSPPRGCNVDSECALPGSSAYGVCQNAERCRSCPSCSSDADCAAMAGGHFPVCHANACYRRAYAAQLSSVETVAARTCDPVCVDAQSNVVGSCGSGAACPSGSECRQRVFRPARGNEPEGCVVE